MRSKVARKRLGSTLQRYGGHVVVLLVIVGAMLVRGVRLPSVAMAAPNRLLATSAIDKQQSSSLRLASIGGPAVVPIRDALSRQDPHTVIPDRPNVEIITYTVESGDTPITIAQQFHLQPETILWGNPDLDKNPELLQIGTVINILPVDGVLHTVVPSDTIESIAATYSVSPTVIVNYTGNHLEYPYTLTPGQRLIIPGGTKDYLVWTAPEPPAPSPGSSSSSSSSSSSGTRSNQSSSTWTVQKAGSLYTGPAVAQGVGAFIWPISSRLINQGYWYGHRGIDINAYIGQPLVAADGGTVIYAGWSTVGYGNLVVIDHGNGFTTYYAHQSQIVVGLGQVVSRGELIGYAGSTGHSTGPHLHFEVRYHGVQQNPLSYLP